MSETVFYAWQSDLPNNCNRSFIEAALRKAVAAVRQDSTVDASPRLDKDTQGLPGSPDIAAAIFSKIETAEAFVADVSIVTNSAGRQSPNPNVLIEVGYALHALGPSRVILLMNTHYGTTELLPFDLRFKRAWSCPGFVDTYPLLRKESRHAEEEGVVHAGVSCADGRVGSVWADARGSGEAFRADGAVDS